ncbi:hypothetical protein [Streptomyces sp. NBC_01669]|uniref:hypothetical protein n=1 Tax=Streptomyces sp. NBC_01669 TaxID=2975909 RepID=UPI0022519A37|nr:hypothetical protein [Streptomyces sp. NBC_01669]MCX4537694.1 hypothetical protein [Streptomyces sp. NBC_01669]
MQREHSEAGDMGLSTEDLARPREDQDADRGTASAAADDAPPSAEGATADAASQEPAAGAPHGSAPEDTQANEPLLGPEEAEAFQSKWTAVQTAFVDDPQEAVRAADALVAEVMQTLAGSFASRKEGLESQWGRGEEVLTEDLRIALQRYRSFFNRLLTT